MQIGIVWLPNVGKSTLFNALTKNSSAEAANYPFCTIDPNVGIVEVPDDRIGKISKIVQPEKIIPAVVEFVDIAWLVKGASTGEGLGNKFLANIRNCDAIAQVVRVFEEGGITHVHNKIDPKGDIEVIEMELILSDLQTIENKIKSTDKEVRANKKWAREQMIFFEKVKEILENEKMANSIELENEDQEIWMRDCHLLTSKPILYIANVSDADLMDFDFESCQEKLGIPNSDQIVPICAKLEEELNDMSEEDSKEFLQELGIQETWRTNLIRAAYKTLGLKTYFTAWVQEVRAWTYKWWMTAPQCAWVIHTDFEKWFICADVISTEDFIKADGWIKGREEGLVKMQGKPYIMQDGDVCLFKFNN